MKVFPELAGLFALVGMCFALALPARSEEVSAEQWPAADVLFKRDSRWRGADAANSIDLGGGRVLWTFGDTFVDANEDAAKRSRRTSVMINNTVAIQTGYDPTRAEFQAYWESTAEGNPAAFFRNEGEVYYWPGGGILLDDKLLNYMMRVRTPKDGKGFEIVGWGAVLIDNPQDDPTAWRKQYFDFDHTTHNIMVGCGSSLRQGACLYTYGANASHLQRGLYLARFAVADILEGDFTQGQWWNSKNLSWENQDQVEGKPPLPILTPGAPEFTVHRDARRRNYLLLQTVGFPLGLVTMRSSPKMTGPWSPRHDLLWPEETKDPKSGLRLYSAKAHPEQEIDGLALTYCTNTKDLVSVMRDESLYYPRFIRVRFSDQLREDAN